MIQHIVRNITQILAVGLILVASSPQIYSQNIAVTPNTIAYFREYLRIVRAMSAEQISDQARALYEKAVTLVELSKVNETLDTLEAGMLADVRREESRVMWAPYARLLGEIGLFNRGIEFLRKLSLQYPKLVHLHASLAGTYGMYYGQVRGKDNDLASKLAQMALGEHEVALALDPNYFQALLGHAMSISHIPSKQHIWEAEYIRLLSQRPTDLHGFPFFTVYKAFIEALINSGDEKKARRVLKDGLQMYPTSAALQALSKKLENGNTQPKQ